VEKSWLVCFAKQQASNHLLPKNDAEFLQTENGDSLKSPFFYLFFFQLNLAGCVIGGTGKFAILIYLPDVLFGVIIQNTTGSSRRE